MNVLTSKVMFRIACAGFLSVVAAACAFGQLAGNKGPVEYYWVAADGTGDYLTIQEAIDDFEYGVVIKVKPGIYRENLILQNWVHIEGTKDVIIDPAEEGPAIEGINLLGAKLYNLTINGNPRSAGIFLVYSKIDIENCLIQNSRVAIEGSKRSNVVLGNSILTGSVEAAVTLDNFSSGRLSGNEIYNNGAGVWIDRGSTCSLINNKVYSNSGDGIKATRSAYGTVRGNVVHSNLWNGMYTDETSIFLIKNNTFAGNGKGQESLSVAGINVSASGTGGILNNIVTGHPTGILNRDSENLISTNRNDVWGNKDNYNNVDPVNDLSVDPGFVDAQAFDFTLREDSPCRKAGQDSLDIGAFFDSDRLAKKKRIVFLKAEAEHRLSKRKWLDAYKYVQKILAISPNDEEAQMILQKAGRELSNELYISASKMYKRGEVKIARNLLEMGFGYDKNNRSLNQLREEIDSMLAREDIEAFIQFFTVLILIGIAIMYFKRRRRLQNQIALVKIWSDDAEELVEKGKFMQGEKYAPDEFKEAKEKLEECLKSIESKKFPYAEVLAKESVKWSERAIEKTNQFKQLRKDAVIDVSNAQSRIKELKDKHIADLFPHDFKSLETMFKQGKHYLVVKDFQSAKDTAEAIDRLIRKVEDNIVSEKQDEVSEMIEETEKLIFRALASNNSAEIVAVLIDFKSEIGTIKQAFENEQITTQDAIAQVSEIKELVVETARLGTEEEVEPGRKKNYYDILGVKSDATFQQIKSVYRKLSMIYHPDQDSDGSLGIDGDERFKEITEAYETLSNPDRRTRYDTEIAT